MSSSSSWSQGGQGERLVSLLRFMSQTHRSCLGVVTRKAEGLEVTLNVYLIGEEIMPQSGSSSQHHPGSKCEYLPRVLL